LNRAIFYAAAKRGFRGGGSNARGARAKTETGTKAEKQEGEYYLGDELAYKDEKKSTKDKPTFAMGEQTQTEENFNRQVKARFHDTFEEAWKEALDYIKSFDKETLLSQSKFFSEVYRPMRDEFAKKWTEMSTQKEQPRKIRS
jgi:hypothetical protein